MRNDKLRHRSHSVGQNAFHLVWKPKYSSSFLRFKEVNKVCIGSIRFVALKYGMEIYELQVMPDHIHLFVELPPSISVSKSLQLFKGISSRILILMRALASYGFNSPTFRSFFLEKNLLRLRRRIICGRNCAIILHFE